MGDALTVRAEYRMQNWAVLIQECKASGLTNKEFCRQQGISEKSYYYWLRKLRNQVIEETIPQIVPLNLEERNEDTLEICYRGAKLQLPGNIEIESVAAILRSIQGRC